MFNHSGAFLKLSRGLIFTMMAFVAFSLQPGIEFGDSARSLTTAMAQEGEEESCPETQIEMIEMLVPSLTAFEVFNSTDFIEDAFDALRASENESFAITLPLFDESTGPSNPEFDLNYTPFEFDESTFSGTLSGNTESGVALQIRLPVDNEGTIREGLIKGMFIRNIDKGESPATNPIDNWYFLEPVRPLLFSILKSRSSTPECSEDDIDKLFPIGNESTGINSWTVAYDVKDTEFAIDLDPYNVDRDGTLAVEHSDSDDRISSIGSLNANEELRNYTQPSCATSKCEIDLFITADYEFITLKGGVFDAKSDIAALLNMLLNGETNFYELFGANVEFRAICCDLWDEETRSIGTSINRSPGSTFGFTPNAYQLLCDYTLNVPHEHSRRGVKTISHLFTGFDLANFPASDPDSTMQISDAADDFCPPGCGGEGRAIVGLAEGIGGFEFDQGLGCSSYPYDQISPFFLPGHHSLSQHHPKADVDGLTSNFDGTLFQRWILFAHEIGHNLRARHVDNSSTKIKSVMNSTINGELNYYIETDNIDQINNP